VALQPKCALAPSLFRFLYYTQLDTRPLGLLWASDQLVAETATCTTHNKHNRRTYMPSAGHEPAIPVIQQPQNYGWLPVASPYLRVLERWRYKMLASLVGYDAVSLPPGSKYSCSPVCLFSDTTDRHLSILIVTDNTSGEVTLLYASIFTSSDRRKNKRFYLNWVLQQLTTWHDMGLGITLIKLSWAALSNPCLMYQSDLKPFKA
jgi:hypothetical protein